jgi:hypothetical protein
MVISDSLYLYYMFRPDCGYHQADVQPFKENILSFYIETIIPKTE